MPRPTLAVLPWRWILVLFGYVEEEYFLSGRARTYSYDDRFELTASPGRCALHHAYVAATSGAILSRFSGVVHFENAHPVQGGHSGWSANRQYILRSGDAYVLLNSGEDALTRGGRIAPEREALRAQLQTGSRPLGSMTVLQRFDPKRYAPIVWPDDDAPRWDAMTQAAAWIRSADEHNPLRGHVQRIYAQGWSFTGSLLRTFINEGFHDRARLRRWRTGVRRLSDRYFFEHVRVGSRVAHDGRINVADRPPPPRDACARCARDRVDDRERSGHEHRSSGRGNRSRLRPPSAVRGAGAHAWGRPDAEGRVADDCSIQLTSRGLPARDPADDCELSRSDVPFAHLASAALANLDAWVTRDVPPPPSARIEIDARKGVARDRLGNARGGVRGPRRSTFRWRGTRIPGADASPRAVTAAGRS